jgi:hypothetical protein
VVGGFDAIRRVGCRPGRLGSQVLRGQHLDREMIESPEYVISKYNLRSKRIWEAYL